MLNASHFVSFYDAIAQHLSRNWNLFFATRMDTIYIQIWQKTISFAVLFALNAVIYAAMPIRHYFWRCDIKMISQLENIICCDDTEHKKYGAALPNEMKKNLMKN